jgi:hypothetical protein
MSRPELLITRLARFVAGEAASARVQGSPPAASREGVAKIPTTRFHES